MITSMLPMHIPDGFLSLAVSIVMWVISIAVIAIALNRVQSQMNERTVPMMGVMAAAIFAGQMLNFPVSGGTSGHLLGAAIATILLGPWAAIVTMTAVVSTQAIVFQDGGLIALGANLFNMAIVGVAVSYSVYNLIKKFLKSEKASVLFSGFLAAWTSIFIASLACALQLALSGTISANISVPAMGGIHAVIGIGEGLITLGALVFVLSTRKDLLPGAEKSTATGSRGILVGGSIITLALTILSPLASSHPDGLEWVAEQKGFLEAARDSFYNIIPDYVFPGIQSPTVATIVAGIIGSAIVFGLVYGVASLRQAQQQSVEK